MLAGPPAHDATAAGITDMTHANARPHGRHAAAELPADSRVPAAT
jgi:hypothetical protein